MKIQLDTIAAGTIAAVLSMAWIEPESLAPRILPVLVLLISLLLFRLKIFTLAIFLCAYAWVFLYAFGVMKNVIDTQPSDATPRQAQWIQVQITELPQQRGSTLRLQGLWQQQRQPAQLIQLSWFAPPDFAQPPQVGDIWWLQARLRPVVSRANQGGFDYQSHLVRQRIWLNATVIKGERMQATQRVSPRSVIMNKLAAWRANAEQPQGLHYLDIVLALTLGERQWLSAERRRLLIETGVAHVMAISGLHVTFVFAVSWWLARVPLHICWRLLAWIPRLRVPELSRQPNQQWLALALGFACALAYAALSGFAVSTLRALALLGLFVMSRIWAWRLTPMQVLLRGVAVILLVDPLAWLDVGFWLSVGAVAVIFFWHWWSVTSITDAASHVGPITNKVSLLWRFEVMLTVLLAPLTIFYFHGIAWLTPLTNLLVIPVFAFAILPLSLLAVSLLLVPFAITEQLAWGLLQLVDPILHTVFQFLATAASWPSAWLETVELRWVLLLALVYLVVHWQQVKQRRWLFGFSSAAVIVVLLQPQQDEFAVHVLDVGQGSAVVIQRDRAALIYDAGPGFGQGHHLGHDVILPFLRQRRLRPEWLVISHEHQDHTGAADALQASFSGLQTMRSRFAFQESSDWGWQPQVFPDELTAATLPCSWGQTWLWQGVQIRALAPMPGPSFGPNNDSCVLLLTYRGQRVLLTGDIQRHTELRMVGRYGKQLRADVLVIPHHGSQTSSQAEFLDVVQPRVAVVSRGFMNQFRMPHRDVQTRYAERGIPLYDTGRDGQVTLRWQSGRSILRAEQEAGWQVQTYYRDWRNRWYARRLPEWQR